MSLASIHVSGKKRTVSYWLRRVLLTYGTKFFLLVFSLESQQYALHLHVIERAVRAVEATPLPKAPDIVLGVVNVQGQVIPILNIRRRFRLPDKEINLSDQLIIARTSRRTVTLLVDTVTGVVERQEEQVTAAEKIVPGMEYVEDSVTSRMLLKKILESAEYLVKTTVDGLEAFTELKEGDYDLVVSDIDMPRMNGFVLASKIRDDKKLAELPVVLVTALESREDRERVMEVGANAYIEKSSFDQSNLLEVVQRLI